MKILYTLILFLTISQTSFSQVSDSVVIRNFYTDALTSNAAYENLHYLCKNIGGRICGSPQAEAAVKWLKFLLESMNLDAVYLQDLMVKSWNRGEKEYGSMTSEMLGEQKNLNVAALGFSVGTGVEGISGNVIEVKTYEELEKLGIENVKGKILFYNRPADPTFINTFRAYGGAVDQRSRGAIDGAKFGAIGVIVRSVTLSSDDYPHTGIMSYDSTLKKIPAIGISTNDADKLSKWLSLDKNLKFYFRTNCLRGDEKPSNNVIAEIRGSEFPDEIIVVGGHIDAWDTGEGAHDDGIGVVQGIEVLRLFKSLNIIPKHTIRFVGFMDEEVAQRGGHKYFDIAKEKNEKHIVAIESDEGGFMPTGFSVDGNDTIIKKVDSWKMLFEPYEIHHIEKGYGGVDIYYLRNLGIPLIGLIVENQRYFDYHHSSNDRFEFVNKREMQFGSAALASLIYLIDKYGL